jgi:hypothetical protein
MNKSILQHLVEATNSNNFVYQETCRICQKEYEYKWKKDLNKAKKDRTKELHLLIKQMLKHASASESKKAGDLCKDLIFLYNRKTNGGLNIKLPQLFKNDGLGKVVFSEGVPTNLWAGIF